MEKTSKIKSAIFKNEWNGQNGTVYYHDVELENGDKGSLGCKTQMPDFLAQGADITYLLADGKMKRVTQPQNGQTTYTGNKGGSRTQEPIELKLAGFAASYTKDLVVAGKVEIADFSKYADKMYDWLISKKGA